MSDTTYSELERAINAHLQDQSGEAVFSTGWVLVSAVSDMESSRYVTVTSEGIQYHSLIGLLSLAKRDAETFADAAIIQQLMQQEDDDD